MKFISQAFSCLSIVVLVGCGGGGSNKQPNPNAVFSIDRNSLEFSAVIGSSDVPQQEYIIGSVEGADSNIFAFVELSGNGVLDTTRTTVSGSQLIVYPAAPHLLTPGLNTDQIVIKICNDPGCQSQVQGSPKTVQIRYQVELPSLYVSTETIDLDAAFSLNDATNTFRVGLNTGNNRYPISVSVNESLENAININAPDDVGQYTSDVELALNSTDDLTPGISTGQVTISSTVYGNTIEQTVDVNIISPKHFLVVPDSGVGLVSIPSASRLTHDIEIRESTGSLTTTWNAVSSANWLSVDNSGVVGNSLSIVANPNGLAANRVHMAQVTITSDDPNIENEQVVNVGLWVGENDPQVTSEIYNEYPYLVTDTVRPYVYMHDGSSDQISVYHVYTRNLVATIENLETNLGDMQISPDGEFLYVLSNTSDEILVVDLASYLVSARWSTEGTINDTGFEVYRPHDKDVLVAGSGAIFYAQTGDAITINGDYAYYYSGSFLDISQNGKRLCAIARGVSPYTLSCFDLAFSSVKGEQKFTSLGSVPHGTGSNGKDVALNSDGSIVYAAAGAPYSFTKVDVTTMSVMNDLSGTSYPNGIEIGVDDRIHATSSSWYGPQDLFIYSNQDLSLRTEYVSGYAENIIDRALAVSADGLVTIVATSDPKVSFFATY